MSLYKSCKTTVSIDRELSSSFSVKVGVHQGSVLSPLLFIMVSYNRSSSRGCEGWLNKGVVVCRRSCFVWGNIK